VSTDEFTEAIIARLGQEPERLRPARFEQRMVTIPELQPPEVHRERAGIDVYVHWDESGRSPALLAQRLTAAVAGGPLGLTLITNRGVEVFPAGFPETLVTDHWRCRFQPGDPSATVTLEDALAVPGRLAAAGIEVVGTDVLQRIDGRPGYSSGASG